MGRIQRRIAAHAALLSLGLLGPAAAEEPTSADEQHLAAKAPGARAVRPAAQRASPIAPERRAPTTSYRIAARLDEVRHVVHANATITWLNRSSRPTSELWFHGYLNAFTPGSLFLTSESGASRSGPKAGKPGALVVHALRIPALGGGDLWPSAAPHSPGLPNDRTDLRLPLPRPVLPGERLEIEVEFSAELPEIVERTGYHGDYHLVAQWYPKLARLEPDGTWAHFPFHPFAEFYSDFGDYEVELDVPRAHVVGASGQLERLGADGERATYRASLRGAVDFAWVSAPELFARTEQVDGTLVRLLLSTDDPNTPHLTAASETLRYLSRTCAPYPYETLTIVEPPEGAARSAGMEYPSFVTTSAAGIYDQLGMRLAELTTVHEVGHQWFQGLLATDERRFPFLDEGVNSYFEARILDELHGGGGMLDWPGFRVSRAHSTRLHAVATRGRRRALHLPAADYPTFGSLSAHVYARTALTLDTLARAFGRERVDGALGDYCSESAGLHPTPRNLYEALAARIGDAGLGRESALALVERLFEQPVHFDLAVGGIETRARGPRSFSSQVRIDGWTLPLPFEVELRFADGSRMRLPSSAVRAGNLRFEHDAALRRVVLDPEAKLLLDEDLGNNRRNVGAPTERPYLTEATLAGLVQLLLRGLGS